MEIFKIIIFEYIFGYILQGFAFVLGVCAFNRQKIEAKKYILTSIALSIITYFVRILPISFGVHIILNLLILLIICIFVLKMPIYITIRSMLLMTVLLLVCEMVNVGLMISILGQEEFEQRLAIPLEKAIVSLPSALVFATIIILSYFMLNKFKKNKNVNVNINIL